MKFKKLIVDQSCHQKENEKQKLKIKNEKINKETNFFKK